MGIIAAVAAELAAQKPPPALSGDDVALIIAALDDAITLRSERAHAYCLACGETEAGMCPEHTGDLAAAEQYRAERDRLEAGR